MPGSCLPSRYSRLAPPPVEMWPNADSSKPSLRTAAAESPPPTTESPSTSVSAWATARVPAAKASNSKTPIGPFQNTVRASASAAANALADSGPMSSPSWSAGMASAGTTEVGASAVNSGATTMSVGQQQLHPGLLGPAEVLPAHLDLVLLQQALAHLVALGLEEGEHHAAADEQPVGLAQQVVDDAELVGDLGATEHHGVRAVEVLGQPPEHVDLGGHEPAHRVREQLRDVVHAGLLAVHDTEPVGDEDVGQRRRARRRRRPARPRPCSSRPC